jgi:hypothetical protein
VIERPSDAHFLHSSSREKVLEHLFIGELLKKLWCMGVHDAEVLRSEVDGSGYDVVVECNGILRHIQLKATHSLGAASRQTVNVAISRKPSGCVVWMLFDEETLALGPFFWFGGAPGAPMPSLGDKLARHTKADSKGFKAERKNIRIIRKSQFQRLASMEDVIAALFGDVGTRRPRFVVPSGNHQSLKSGSEELFA